MILPPLPTPTTEAWRFTNLPRVLENMVYTPLCTTPGCLEAALPVVVGPQLVFHNGVLAPAVSHSISLAPGVTVTPAPNLSPAPYSDALDDLSFPIATHLHIPHTLALPLHIIYVMSGPPSTARIHISLAPHTTATLIEHYVAAPSFCSWQHVHTTFTLGAHSNLTHSLQNALPPACVLTRRAHITLAPSARVTTSALQAGGQFSRVETHIQASESTFFSYTGLTCCRHTQMHDTTFSAAVSGENNTLEINQKNAVSDAGTAIFQGLFHVFPKAQHTDANMHVQSLLLSPESRAFHKPELSIFADDVRCTHGAAIGGLDETQLFYLQSRGIPPLSAQRLLTEGFMRSVAETAFPESIRPLVNKQVFRFLTDTAHNPSTDPNFEPFSADFMTQRSPTPFQRETDDTLEITDV